jgi:hypothetical protein
MLKNNPVINILQIQFQTISSASEPFTLLVISFLGLYWGYIAGFLCIVVALVCVYQLVRIYLIYKESQKPFTILELIPPTDTEQSSFTTSQLFTSVHGLLRQRKLVHRLFDFTRSCSFEIVSSKEKGIRYILRISSDDEPIIKKSLFAYLPGIKVNQVDDYVTEGRVLAIRLSNHFAFPLKKLDNLKEYDPIAYITGTMTKLADDEIVGVQVVVSPVSAQTKTSVARLRSLFLGKRDVLSVLQTGGSSNMLVALIKVVLQIFLFPLGLVIWVFTGGREGPLLRIGSFEVQLPESTYRDVIETQIKQKIDQQLFSVSFRLLTVSKYRINALKIQKGFITALSPFANSSLQSLQSKHFLKFNVVNSLYQWLYTNRLNNLFSSLVLSTSELSDLYHFPYTKTTKTENISKVHSKELPAPLSLKQRATHDIYFAKNTYGGTDTMIGMTEDERRRHMYILGATGTGKSTMLLSMIKQDIDNNKGLCVVDPHGDLTDQIISVIPNNRINDVVYFNPDDISYPMGINLLEQTSGLTPEETIREQEFIAESIISVFQKIYTDKYSGPRMEYILRNTIHTAFTVPGATLFTIYKLLINTNFRKSVTTNLTDENLRDFWKYEFAKAGDYQKVKMISPITNKIGRFLFSPTAKRILEQPQSTVNFESIMNNGKILLCNLSKGKIGEDNSSVFGVLIMAKIQLASFKRARMKPEDRKDFYLYVDEFQNFATPAFAQILSEARKYRLNAILAHQTTSQLEDTSLVNVTLANTGTVVCFRTANPEDERVILPQFQPYVEHGEIASLPSYHFYMRLGALNPEEPFSGITIPVKVDYSKSREQTVIESSRKLYAKKYTGTEVTMHKPDNKMKPKIVLSGLP